MTTYQHLRRHHARHRSRPPRPPRPRPSDDFAPIPLSRIVSVELRKMFDTRSGFWLMCSIGILSLLATASVLLFGSEAGLTYSSFAAAIGFPMAVVLPIIASSRSPASGASAPD